MVLWHIAGICDGMPSIADLVFICKLNQEKEAFESALWPVLYIIEETLPLHPQTQNNNAGTIYMLDHNMVSAKYVVESCDLSVYFAYLILHNFTFFVTEIWQYSKIQCYSRL